VKAGLILCFACLIAMMLGGLSALGTDGGATTGNRTYLSIQAAIDAAAPGAVIWVAPGTYEENLVIDTPVTLKGRGASDVTLQARDVERPAVLIRGDGAVTLSGFTITGAKTDVQVEGSCVNLCDNTLWVDETGLTGWSFVQSESTVAGNRILGSRGSGVILIGTSRWRIENNWFKGLGTGLLLGGAIDADVEANKVTACGDGIRIGGSALVTVSGNTIVGNSLSGVVLSDAAHATLTDNTIRGNVGWGVSLAGGPCEGLDGSFVGTINGRANSITGNAKGDLCPADDNWPVGFADGS
jgi:parallel beta-helix repeat protein